MKFKLDNKYIRWGLTAFVVIAASITFYYFIFNNSNIRAGINNVIDILMPVVTGLVTAYLLTPILNFTEAKILIPLFNKCKIKESTKRKSAIRAIGILLTAVFFIAVIYLLIYMLMSQIVPSVQSIILNFDSYTSNFIDWINKILEDNPEFGAYITKTIDQYSDQLEGWLEEIVPSTISLIKTVSLSVITVIGYVWDFIIGFIISIYVLANKERFAGHAKKIIYAFFETETANIVVKNFRFTHKTFIGFLGGKIVDSMIICVLCLIGTAILRTPYAVLVSVIVGVTNIIPFFGPFLGAIPSAFLILLVDPMNPLNCVYFVIFILLLQQFDGNILGPKILGDATGLNGFWVIFAITFFGGLFGVLGMIAGVPIFSVIYAAIKSIVNTKLEKKKMPTETEDYKSLDYVDENGLLCQTIKNSNKNVKILTNRRVKKDKEKDEISDSKSHKG